MPREGAYISLNKLASLWSHIFLSLQLILMKFRVFTRFSMIYGSMEVVFCLSKEIQKVLMLRDIDKRVSRGGGILRLRPRKDQGSLTRSSPAND